MQTIQLEARDQKNEKQAVLATEHAGLHPGLQVRQRGSSSLETCLFHLQSAQNGKLRIQSRGLDGRLRDH